MKGALPSWWPEIAATATVNTANFKSGQRSLLNVSQPCELITMLIFVNCFLAPVRGSGAWEYDGRGSHVHNINVRVSRVHGAVSNEGQVHVEDEWANSLVVT